MVYLENIKIGDTVMIQHNNTYYKDIILRKLKTKVECKTGEFLIKDGKIIGKEDKIIIEMTDDVKTQILSQEYFLLLKNMQKMTFENNKSYEGFIQKVRNLYNANKKHNEKHI